jgi:hypothetical protein
MVVASIAFVRTSVSRVWRRGGITMLRLYTGGDGQSHLTELNPPKAPMESAMQATTGVVFWRSEPGYFMDWHNAPHRQYVITLSSYMEMGLGNGTVRRLAC